MSHCLAVAPSCAFRQLCTVPLPSLYIHFPFFHGHVAIFPSINALDHITLHNVHVDSVPLLQHLVQDGVFRNLIETIISFISIPFPVHLFTKPQCNPLHPVSQELMFLLLLYQPVQILSGLLCLDRKNVSFLSLHNCSLVTLQYITEHQSWSFTCIIYEPSSCVTLGLFTPKVSPANIGPEKSDDLRMQSSCCPFSTIFQWFLVYLHIC